MAKVGYHLFLFHLCLFSLSFCSGQYTERNIPNNWHYVDSSPHPDGSILCKSAPPIIKSQDFYAQGARSALQICGDSRRGGGWVDSNGVPRSGIGARCGNFMYPKNKIVFIDPPSFDFDTPRLEDAEVRLWCQTKCTCNDNVFMDLSLLHPEDREHLRIKSFNPYQVERAFGQENPILGEQYIYFYDSAQVTQDWTPASPSSSNRISVYTVRVTGPPENEIHCLNFIAPRWVASGPAQQSTALGICALPCYRDATFNSPMSWGGICDHERVFSWPGGKSSDYSYITGYDSPQTGLLSHAVSLFCAANCWCVGGRQPDFDPYWTSQTLPSKIAKSWKTSKVFKMPGSSKSNKGLQKLSSLLGLAGHRKRPESCSSTKDNEYCTVDLAVNDYSSSTDLSLSTLQACNRACRSFNDCSPSPGGSDDTDCRCLVNPSLAVRRMIGADPVVYGAWCVSMALVAQAITSKMDSSYQQPGKRGLDKDDGLNMVKDFSKGCPCNSTYISLSCCESVDGLVWESLDLKLGEL